MAYIKEPKDVDFFVSPSTLTAEDVNIIHEAIAEYRRSGKKIIRTASQRNKKSYSSEKKST